MKETKRINFVILFVFVLIEAFFFKKPSSIQYFITFIEYGFITVLLFLNLKKAISYFIMFTLLSLGGGDVVETGYEFINFRSVRFFGFSLNILYSLILLVFCVLRRKKIDFKNNIVLFFFLYFAAYCALLGFFNVALSVNYLDNFIRDAFTYLPFFIYVSLINFLNKETLHQIVVYGLILSCSFIFFSFFFDLMVGDPYSERYFLASNSFSFILAIAIFLNRKNFNKYLFLILAFLIVYGLSTGIKKVGAKQITLFFIVFIWFSFKGKHKILFSGLTILILTSIVPVFNFFINYYEGNYISFKFSQILELFYTFDLRELAQRETSLGNLAAELLAIISHFSDNVFYFLFGKGFGGGVPDTFGHLNFWSGNSGYAQSNALRNDYFKMHLPIFEIFIKSGLLGLLFYLRIFMVFFRKQNNFSLLFIIMFFTVFYVSKESFLLTLIFLELSNKNLEKIEL